MSAIEKAQQGERVTVGLSGGVDSSVASLLLKRQGYHVNAVFMKNWEERDEENRCLWEEEVEDCLQVCEKMDIPFEVVNLSKPYWEKVFQDFLAGYARGETPNPDILCNQHIKFTAFLDHAMADGASQIATGHYAQVAPSTDEVRLLKGVDANKDQSYFLCRLTQKQLKTILFPLGALTKQQVRALAKEAEFKTHDKADSVGICFIGEVSFRQFLSRYLSTHEGEIRHIDDHRLLGSHPGALLYTIGQRSGLGIGGITKGETGPWYVVHKEITNNTLYVTNNKTHPLLNQCTIKVTQLHWIREQIACDITHAMENSRENDGFSCYAKIRYRQGDQSCKISCHEKDHCTVTFKQPQWAIAPGQYVVFYQGDECIGSGIIKSAA